MHGASDLEKYRVVEGIELAKLHLLPHHVCLRWLHKEESKGGVLLPQNRWRARFTKGQVLAVGPGVNPRLKWGALVMFNALGSQENPCEKEFLGVQDPPDRDTVFICEDIHMLGTLTYDTPESDPRVEMLDNWVLVEPDDGADEKRGLAVPDAYRNQERVVKSSWTGRVKGVGEYVDTCKAGDWIAYETLGAVSIMLEDKPHVVIFENPAYGNGGMSVQMILESIESPKEAANA